jgi:transposase-like protein
MLNPLHCPDCLSEHVEEYSHYETKSNGNRKLYQCTACQKIFSETKSSVIEGLKKPISFIIHVLKAGSEGLGFNATCRTFDISKNTLLNWERRFAPLKVPLIIYALLHTFLTQLIEGTRLPTTYPSPLYMARPASNARANALTFCMPSQRALGPG